MIGDKNFSSGTLTEFSGFPLKKASGYSYLEARRVLKLAMEALRRDTRLVQQLSMDPTIPGRSAITGKDEDVVWDYLSLASAKDSFPTTLNHPHLTLDVGQNVVPVITIPNSINTSFRRSLIHLGKDGFLDLVRSILSNMEKEVSFRRSSSQDQRCELSNCDFQLSGLFLSWMVLSTLTCALHSPTRTP